MRKTLLSVGFIIPGLAHACIGDYDPERATNSRLQTLHEYNIQAAANAAHVPYNYWESPEYQWKKIVGRLEATLREEGQSSHINEIKKNHLFKKVEEFTAQEGFTKWLCYRVKHPEFNFLLNKEITARGIKGLDELHLPPFQISETDNSKVVTQANDLEFNSGEESESPLDKKSPFSHHNSVDVIRKE